MPVGDNSWPQSASQFCLSVLSTFIHTYLAYLILFDHDLAETIRVQNRTH